MVYADTGLLCSLYSPDSHSKAAIQRLTTARSPVAVVWLHQLELRNALRLRVFRRDATPAQRNAALNAFMADLAAGVYDALEPDIRDVLLEAERLSATHTETLGTRSLDILHVAIALVLGAHEFWTFDQRQAALARAAGLKVRCPAYSLPATARIFSQQLGNPGRQRRGAPRPTLKVER